MAAPLSALNADESAPCSEFFTRTHVDSTGEAALRKVASDAPCGGRGGVLTFNMYTQVCTQMSPCTDADKQDRHIHIHRKGWGSSQGLS